jgi:lipoprotein-releasing system ATP-binding protein
MSKILEAVGVTKYFVETGSRLDVLKGVDFVLQQGEIVALTGVSGAGKSTFLNILGALDHPNDGMVLFKEQDLAKFSNEQLDAYRRNSVGFIFQFHHLLPDFTALENVMLPGRIAGRNVVDIKKEALELLEMVGLQDRTTHLPSELSGGERQRTAVARALMNAPEVVMADEPSGNLDETNSVHLHELFVKLNKELNQTFLIVTHDKSLSSCAHREVKMAGGLVL